MTLRLASADVDTVGIIVAPTATVLVFPHGTVDASLMDKANVLLSAAAAE